MKLFVFLCLAACHGKTDAHLRTQADSAWQSGDLERASALFLEIIENDPDDAAAHRDLALTLASRGLDDSAIEHYRIYLQLKPDAEDAAEVGRRVFAGR